ncbi:tetratricopeptide repeat protein [Maritimibacter sp. HL-12]|uniref:tetratricopeptide repeat protein n=1 Tax=Maritimibacter sp. HL-12 TaxID=1162418 RepID=UPI000A0F3E6D|nr:tetratricopeptide repeat protein [Maritimibacter sp. HL-12]SMH40914.1 Flp pilus assembly protein TadD, contains TPR repeats [Maritimibacter sp. HL-12]
MPHPLILRALGLSALMLGVTLAPARADDGFAGAYLAARSADQSADYTAVVEYGARALAADSENSGLMEGLIIAQIGLGQIEQAVPVARRLIAEDDDNQVAGLVLMADAMKREDWNAVLAQLDEGVSVGGFLDQMIEAWSFIGTGQMGPAVALFDDLADDSGTRQAALIQKALALALVGDHEGAARIFSGEDEVLQLNRAGIIAYAQVLSQLERNADAAAMLATTFPDTVDAELVTLREELEAGKPIAFTAISGAREGLSRLFYEVADSLAGETDPGLVLIYARIAEFLDPATVGATLVTAAVLEEVENYALAAESYARVPQDHQAFPQAQLGRAQALRRMDRVEEAIEVLETLIAARPELAPAHAALGDTYRFEQRFAEATPHYDDAIALYDRDRAAQWSVYFARGIALEREGRWPEAERDFRKALELSPDQPSVLNYLGYSYVEKRENLDEALDMIQRAVEARPFDGYIRDSLGWVYYRLGRYEDAVGEMERAVELMPLDPVLNDHLGDTYWAVGRLREARFQWSRALSFITDETNLEELDPDRIRRKLDVGLDVVLEEEGGEPITR